MHPQLAWRRCCAWAVASAIVLFSAQAFAQAYPSRPIRLVVPSSIGSVGDIVARSLMLALKDKPGIVVNIENMDGSNGTIAADIVAKSAPDGYTLLLGNETTHVLSPLRYKSFPYSPVDDFTPIAGISEERYVLLVHPSVAAGTTAELIEIAKKSSVKFKFGTYAPSVIPLLSGAALAAMGGMEMENVEFANIGRAMDGIADNQVQLLFAAARAAKPQVEKGRVKVLGIGGAPLAEMPGVAPISNSIPGFDASAWFAVFGPAKLPPEVRQYLNESITASLAHPRMKNLLGLLPGTTITPRTPEEVAALIAQDTARRKLMVQAAGLPE